MIKLVAFDWNGTIFADTYYSQYELRVAKVRSRAYAKNLLDYLLGRSKKDKLKNYIKENNLSADEVLIVGDTVEEIEIGRELKITTVAITDGNCSKIRLKRAKPDYLIHNLKEVIDIIF